MTKRQSNGRYPVQLLTLALAGLFLAGSCARDRGRERLAIAYEDGLISLDPHLQDENITMSVLSNIYEGLVGFDPDMKIVPLAAVGYYNPSLLEWRFYL
ncbi:MAG: hypothetical protein QME74_00600, partial [Candidatus Edwardsbacteria bacterium]|nr:hypothetical protein [Candidatus Edwardsbacteria bacterium]